MRRPPFLFPFSSKLRMRDGFFILLCIEKMYNHATQGVPSYTTTRTTPSRLPVISCTVLFLVWSMFIFGLLRAILRVKDGGKALKLRILKHSGLSFLLLAFIAIPNTLFSDLQRSQSRIKWFFVILWGVAIVFGGLSFLINKKWILSKMEISPTKKILFALGLTILSIPIIFFLCSFFELLGDYSSLPVY